jgi:hypothetical protein
MDAARAVLSLARRCARWPGRDVFPTSRPGLFSGDGQQLAVYCRGSGGVMTFDDQVQTFGQRTDRYFGAVTELRPDGSAVLRRLDDKGIVILDAVGARMVGNLRIGTKIEFEIVGEPGAWRAFRPSSLESGGRHLGVIRN